MATAIDRRKQVTSAEAGTHPAATRGTVLPAGKSAAPEVTADAADGSLVREVRQALGLTLQNFARMTGFSVRSIASWERGARIGEAGLRRMQEIRALQEALCALAEPGSIGPWLLTPNEEFGGLKPLEVIERGEVHRLWQVVYWLQSGVPS